MNITITPEMIIFSLTALVCVVATSITVVGMMLIMRDTSKLSEVPSRLSRIENLVQTVGVNFQLSQLEENFTNMLREQQSSMTPPTGPQGKTMYRSADGKYVANSPSELFEKMANDPGYGINHHDIEVLRKFFENIIEEDSQQEDDDDGDNMLE